MNFPWYWWPIWIAATALGSFLGNCIAEWRSNRLQAKALLEAVRNTLARSTEKANHILSVPPERD